MADLNGGKYSSNDSTEVMLRNNSILILPATILAGAAYFFAPEGDVHYGPDGFLYPVADYIENSMPGRRDDAKVVSHSEIENGLCADGGASVYVTYRGYDREAHAERAISYRIPCDRFIDAWVGGDLIDVQAWGRSSTDPTARRVTAIVSRDPDVAMQFGETSFLESRSKQIGHITRNARRPDCAKLTVTLVKCPQQGDAWSDYRVRHGHFVFVDDVTKISDSEHFLYFLCKLDWGTYSCASRSWLEYGVEINLQFVFDKKVEHSQEALQSVLDDISGWVEKAESMVRSWELPH